MCLCLNYSSPGLYILLQHICSTSTGRDRCSYQGTGRAFLLLQEVYCKSVLAMSELLERALTKPAPTGATPTKKIRKLKTLSASEQEAAQ